MSEPSQETLGTEIDAVTDPRVEAVLSPLDGVTSLDLADRFEVYRRAHEQLATLLQEADVP